MSEERKEQTVSGYIATAVVNGILFWLVNAIGNWNIRFITGEWAAVLWALNLSILATIVVNAMLVFFHLRFLHYVGKVGLGILSLLAGIVMVTVYPFDFSYINSWLNTVVRIVLYVGVGGTAIAIVVDSVKLLGSVVGRRG
jgi:glucan phosphoethanolaminetransferase (alkaline phosphatase superfamily)